MKRNYHLWWLKSWNVDARDVKIHCLGSSTLRKLWPSRIENKSETLKHSSFNECQWIHFEILKFSQQRNATRETIIHSSIFENFFDRLRSSQTSRFVHEKIINIYCLMNQQQKFHRLTFSFEKIFMWSVSTCEMRWVKLSSWRCAFFTFFMDLQDTNKGSSILCSLHCISWLRERCLVGSSSWKNLCE